MPCACYNRRMTAPPSAKSPSEPLSQSESAEPTTAKQLHFKRSSFYTAIIPLAFVTGLAVGYLFWGRSQAATTAPQADAPKRLDVSLDDDPSIGPADAPITIVEFSDFNCPYCRKWQQETFPALMASYPGQIHFVYRDFPVTSQESYIAAQAAECAGDQGKYWEFHNALFSGKHGLGTDAYTQYAKEIGIDGQSLLDCISSGKYADEVQADAAYAASLGATGTPTFFINGLPFVGAQPLANFKQVIDSELQAK
jgi:protein-disulfide isomerase